MSRITASGGRAVAVHGDVSKVDGSRGLFAAAQKEFGPLDILVNNAGIYEFNPLEAVDESQFDRQYNLNVKGLLFATQEAVKQFGDRGGSVINISSIVSTSPLPGASVYSSTKAAVDAITKSLSAELGPKKIRVNSVLPGPTESEGFNASAAVAQSKPQFIAQTAFGRLGTGSDIAGVVSFLASSDAGWVTGQLIAASGGFRA